MDVHQDNMPEDVKSDAVTARLELSSTQREDHIFRTIELSLNFWEVPPDDYSTDTYEDVPYYYNIKKHINETLHAMDNFLWEEAFKVGQYGIKAIFKMVDTVRAPFCTRGTYDGI
jgi:hypothetical protein